MAWATFSRSEEHTEEVGILDREPIGIVLDGVLLDVQFHSGVVPGFRLLVKVCHIVDVAPNVVFDFDMETEALLLDLEVSPRETANEANVLRVLGCDELALTSILHILPQLLESVHNDTEDDVEADGVDKDEETEFKNQFAIEQFGGVKDVIGLHYVSNSSSVPES